MPTSDTPLTMRSIPVEWHVPDEMRALYATHIVVQQAENETFLLFFQAQPPIIIGDDQQKREQLNALPAVKAECVAKIVMSPTKLPDVINLLQGILARSRTAEDKGENS